jgi:hypothetical protein
MHMDESKPSIPPGKFDLRSASGWTSDDIDPPSAELNELSGLERQTRCGQIGVFRSDFSAVDVYCRNKQEVSRGFLIALSVMGVAPVEQLPEPTTPSSGVHAHEPNKPARNGAALSVEKSESSKED